MINHTSIFLLESITPVYKDDVNGNEVLDINDKFEIKIYRERVGVFSNIEKVEEAITKLIQYQDKYLKHSHCWKYFGFLVNELYLDDCFYGDGYTSCFESTRSYLNDGTLNYFSDLDDRCLKEYCGSDNPGRFVHPGDFVYCLAGHRLIPALVDQIPFTKDEWKKQFKSGVVGDLTDDSGTVYTLDGHRHPMWTRVFPVGDLVSGMTEDLKKLLIRSRSMNN